MKKFNFIFAKFLILTSLFLFSCQSIKVQENYDFPLQEEFFIPQEFTWQKIEDGIELTSFENLEIPLKYFVVKIDLQNPKLELKIFPQAENFSHTSSNQNHKAKYFKSQSTQNFSKENDCLVAINAAPFNTSTKLLGFFSDKRQILGIHKVQNVKLNPCVQKYSALGISKIYSEELNQEIYVPQIYENQNDAEFENEENVLGGFFTILKDSKITQNFNIELHDARIAVAYPQDKKFLYLLAVEKYKDESIGLSFLECAFIFKALNCSDAMEFDGGSSSQLIVKNQNVLKSSFTKIQASSFGFKIDGLE